MKTAAFDGTLKKRYAVERLECAAMASDLQRKEIETQLGTFHIKQHHNPHNLKSVGIYFWI